MEKANFAQEGVIRTSTELFPFTFATILFAAGLPSSLAQAVDVALDSQDRLELAKNLDFYLVILDIVLPGLDGWQV